MRKLMLLLVAATALAIGAPAAATTFTVQIVKTGFVPATMTIATDDTVVWRNADSVSHQIVADNGTFASPMLKPGETFSFTFRAAGTYRYRDVNEPRERGTITVRGLPPSVSIAASQPIVTFGGSVHITGRVSNGRAGETVRILSRPYPQSSYVVLAEVLTTAGGSFDYVTKPTILNAFLGTWRSTNSVEVKTEVRPRVALLYNRTTRVFTARATSERSMAGKIVYLQRYSSVLGRWVTVKRVLLNSLGSRQFRATLRKGWSRVRAYMTVNQAGAGYLDGWSGSLAVKR
jgi:plastocyanin